MVEPTGDQRRAAARERELLSRTYLDAERPEGPWLCRICWNKSMNAEWEQLPETPGMFKVAALRCTSDNCDAVEMGLSATA